MLFSYKTLFLLEADTFSLVEIKRLNIQSDNPGEVYFWFRFDKVTSGLELLEFVSMNKDGDEQQREFLQGKLQFNQSSGTYSTAEDSSLLQLKTAASLPLELDDAIQRHFIGA
ncbi:hypothetical protein SAMN06265337_1541 [Hymenobacter gelipurpurascens]|uniref:Uncharacterized protein n=1 Tax=Hymenobacter gelipurpurascens TaxID=89968 RepID=A0A212TJH8_9BACT|nr:hypothetical protein [Hymenobacter gelipurpurascens]SNC66229.1 hypothetical protein SAMN06265337_1541 [Hymenobacter gelipurpurascens]